MIRKGLQLGSNMGNSSCPAPPKLIRLLIYEKPLHWTAKITISISLCWDRYIKQTICYFYLLIVVKAWVQIERPWVQISAHKPAIHIVLFFLSLRSFNTKSAIMQTIMYLSLLSWNRFASH